MRDALHTPGPTLVQDEIWGRVEGNFRFLKGLTQLPDQTKSLGAYALHTARTKTASEAPNLARTKTRYFVTRRVRHLGGLSGVLVLPDTNEHKRGQSIQ